MSIELVGEVKTTIMATRGEQFRTSSDPDVQDVEKTGDYAHLTNSSVQNFTWENVTVTVKDRNTGAAKAILNNCSGIVKAGMNTPGNRLQGLIEQVK
jgi:hypothetical protein